MLPKTKKKLKLNLHNLYIDVDVLVNVDSRLISFVTFYSHLLVYLIIIEKFKTELW